MAREIPEDDVLLPEAEARAELGGAKPISRSALYRGMESGVFPRPIRVGLKANRWLRSELRAALRAAVDARDNGRAA